jgi:hypothetical protein
MKKIFFYFFIYFIFYKQNGLSAQFRLNEKIFVIFGVQEEKGKIEKETRYQTQLYPVFFPIKFPNSSHCTWNLRLKFLQQSNETPNHGISLEAQKFIKFDPP